MSEPNLPSYLAETLALLSASVIAVPVAKRLGLGSVIGFLIAGIALGPFGFKLFHDPHDILHVAELGVVLLLFVIGLELEPARLWKMKRDIFGLGSSQVIISGCLLVGCTLLAGASLNVALVTGFGLALSSTAFALQILQERGHFSTPYGQKAFGILLLQDMAIVPLLAMVALLAPRQSETNGNDILFIVSITVAAVAFVLLSGRYLLNPFFQLLARSKAKEIMLAAALLVALGSASVMQMVGLSMALGAFLSGVMLAESSFRHSLEADINPFRTLLMGLFFMGVGMALQLDVVANNWQLVLFGVLVLMLLKGVVIWVLARLFGSPNSDALRIAVTLPQGGEFAFVLFSSAVSTGILTGDTSSILTAVVILSMLFTPFASFLLDFAASKLKRVGTKSSRIESFDDATASVLVIGYGRFGMMVSQMLTSEGIAVTALDNQPERISYARKYGIRVYYGDATRPDVLKAAGGENASLIALCIENDQVMKQAIALIRDSFPNVPLFCRATDRAHALELTRMGVDYQIRETFESSIVFGRKALEQLGLPTDRIEQVEADVRQRDDKRLEKQLTGGDLAGADYLHMQTPRGESED
ncbi:monovalent cation:proton antiporter-2 (CPA2) family protein [Polycladidibacter stylochi]|uniref:monovalent cation:proton antiporter-2 (CPA2) family protein n=1 Tax=Polycladidibacter stylochi TaxID=1807766 RepID=UPI0008297BF2|nr:monovalent cation:proton antiporter-2 (CPA2) family protein [Pseudovibrio stylochi]